MIPQRDRTLGAVVIGRNEGDLLRCALLSVCAELDRIVYVDSGSSDGSVELARSLGVPVLELVGEPFTAARARSAGLALLQSLHPELRFVQFLDGDSALEPGWMSCAARRLEADPGLAAVCGRLRERDPDASIFTLLSELEWDGALGDVETCGGIATFRLEALQQTGGFRPELVAGEEPDLCNRLRADGWRIERLDTPMGTHDASRMDLKRWWARCVRAGFAFAEVAWLTRSSETPVWVRENFRILGWGVLLPVLLIALMLPFGAWSGLLLLAYPLLGARIHQRTQRSGRSAREARVYAAACVLSKLPELIGFTRFHAARLLRRDSSAKPSEWISRVDAGELELNAASRPARLKIGYLINQYPLSSHKFIRREIAALEELGNRVVRYTIRDVEDELPDVHDLIEREKTRGLLSQGFARLLGALCASAILRPRRFGGALALAIRVGIGSDRGLLLHLAYLAEACLLLRCLREDACEHLHAHFGTNSAAVAMLCHELGGPPFSITIHGPEEFDRPALLSLDEKIGRAEFSVAVSEYGRSQLMRWAPPNCWDKIHVVRCGVDSDFLQPQPAVPARRLVCVGRFCEQKGHLTLLRAAEILASRGLSFEIVIVGDGELRPEIEAAIDRAGLREAIRLIGWADSKRVRGEICAARALVQPSFAEGLPVVLMEALALGRPVISTWIAGIPELIEPGRNGWLVPAGSPEKLAAALEAALDAPIARLEEMGRAGFERVRALHDSRAEAAKLEGLFNPLRAGEAEIAETG